MKKFNRIISNDTIFVIVIFISVFTIFNSLRPFPAAVAEKKKLEDQLIKQEDEEKKLKDVLKTISDPKTKLEAARVQYQISKKGDVIFVFPERSSDDEQK